MEAARVGVDADVWIEESNRPYELNVNELADAGLKRRFHVNRQDVEMCIERLAIAIDMTKPDTVMVAVSILFLMMVWEWNLKVGSVLQFANNFLNRPANLLKRCHGLRTHLRDNYERTVTRYDTVKLSTAINATEVLKGPKEYKAPEKRYF